MSLKVMFNFSGRAKRKLNGAYAGSATVGKISFEAELREQVTAEVLNDIHAHLPHFAFFTLIGAAAAAFLYWSLIPKAGLLAWLLAFVLVAAFRIAWGYFFSRRLGSDSQTTRQWYRLWHLTSLMNSALWGVAAWFFYEHGGVHEKILLCLMVFIHCLSALLNYSERNTFYEYCAICLLPLSFRMALPGDTSTLISATCVLLIFFVLGSAVRAYLFRSRARGDKLMRELLIEKASVDAARQDAEVANRAKTQFFAAASHDLRQPLHAMGLFAEALRQRNHDPEVNQLVMSINGSVDALENLFSELLDITKIDAGGVDVVPEHFNVNDVFRKLRLHFEPTAFEKGLTLRFRGERCNLHADPLLVERILRNLVSNAIRYTIDGSVLISCRRRQGAMVLQVWDTGIGISQSDQSRIFEEFYQGVDHADEIPAQQSKGLGLGLSIVKRLANLMEAPLSLTSEPGRGSTFSLLLPMGETPQARVPGDATDKLLSRLTLEHNFIVVIDDEPPVREALDILLRSWGAQVASFENVQAWQAWAQGADGTVMKPDLLIVDYGAELGRTGIEAIHEVRGSFGHVPAIMVTGRTVANLEALAQQHDFHLLLKPVVPNKLRAMINFKLTDRSARP